MNELTSLVFTEKYRPKSFDDLIFMEKDKLLNFLKNPKALPSFIFHSSSPGTGKTSCAKIIASSLNTDIRIINSSMDRGIDTIREEINIFARGMSMNPDVKRLVFLDEADGLTKVAQDSLKNLMETYSDNCFFILSCNDLSKIIEPIRSRCVLFNFNKPNRLDIVKLVEKIAKAEGITLQAGEATKIVDSSYPDIRKVSAYLQEKKVAPTAAATQMRGFLEELGKLKARDIEYFKQKIYSGELDIMEFNKYLFRYILDNHRVIGLDKSKRIALLLADTEKSYNLGVNLDIVFFANLLSIMEIGIT